MAQASSSQKFSSGFESSHFRAAKFSSMLEQCSSLQWLVNTPNSSRLFSEYEIFCSFTWTPKLFGSTRLGVILVSKEIRRNHQASHCSTDTWGLKGLAAPTLLFGTRPGHAWLGQIWCPSRTRGPWILGTPGRGNLGDEHFGGLALLFGVRPVCHEDWSEHID